MEQSPESEHPKLGLSSRLGKLKDLSPREIAAGSR
ncbi:hypothetical protein COLO4_06130 [Corchorus olitorius]|uniref:Uncharacterized protein n=1 Tax=Corchorus olitorius TaxID=93759 RepID=A0A1R3KNX4_9ROSI|nr:hypothetical protein COLO4_06130 [Corchorus olitorius]